MADSNLKWFASRMIKDRSYVLQFLEHEGVETSRINDLPTLLFLHCDSKKIEDIRSCLYDRVLFYRAPDKTHVEAIPDRVMKTFLILAPYHDEPVIYLSIDDPHFLEGKRKRVTSGLFKGCEGVVKRIKGERRLIVQINARAAIATPYIPKEFLEDLEDEKD